jgi:site-specific recombinase XerD
MTLQDAYNAFIYQKTLAGLSRESLKDYFFFLKGFLAFVGLDSFVEDLTLQKVNDYIFSLYQKRLSKASVSTYIRNLKIFLTWLQANDWITFSAKGIKIPKMPKKSIQIYDNNEIQLIFDSIHSNFPWLVARNRAMVALMLDSGIRQGELCHLLKRDISFTEHRMKVHGKGDKERFVPLGSLASKYLLEYWKLCPFPDRKEAFVSTDGVPVSKNAVRLLMYRLSASLPFEFSSHKLRHNFATNYCLDKLRSGGQVDACTLQILLGHESIVTTQRYIHCALELLAVQSSISHLDLVFGSKLSSEK